MVIGLVVVTAVDTPEMATPALATTPASTLVFRI